MSSDDELRGAPAGKYQIHQRLAVGGACDVYLAKHAHKDLWVAVKVIKKDHATVKAFQRQLQNEYSILCGLRSRYLPRVVDLTEVSGRPAIVMQLGPEYSLSHCLNHNIDIQWRPLLCRLAETLSYLHSQDVIHNDLKPENVLVYPDGNILLIDFGLARKLRTTTEVTAVFRATILGRQMATIYPKEHPHEGQTIHRRTDHPCSESRRRRWQNC